MVISCRRGAAEFEVSFAELQGSEWMLQIAPANVPGVVARLRGGKSSAQRDDVLALATCIHDWIAGVSSDQRRRWDGFPDAQSSPSPTPWGVVAN
jgi:hypothetical protein